MTTGDHDGSSPTRAELLHWSVSRTGDEVRVSVAGEVDLSTAGGLSDLLAALVDTNPARVVVDLQRVSFLDSSGIACLTKATMKASDAGCTLVVKHPSDLVLRTLQIVGVDNLLLDHTSESDAGTR